jgi:Homeodomain-like domain
MSTKELSRLAVVQDFAAGRISAAVAAQTLHITYRQVFRLRRNFLEKGPASLTSQLRGKPGKPAAYRPW